MGTTSEPYQAQDSATVGAEGRRAERTRSTVKPHTGHTSTSRRRESAAQSSSSAKTTGARRGRVEREDVKVEGSEKLLKSAMSKKKLATATLLVES